MSFTCRASRAAEQRLHGAAVSGCGCRAGAKRVAPGVKPAPVVGPVKLLTCNTNGCSAEIHNPHGCCCHIMHIHTGVPVTAGGAPGQ